MRKFNLVKSLTRVMNNSKGLLILCLITSVFGVNDAWGYSSTKLTANAVGGGKVAVTTSTSKPSSYSSSDSKQQGPHGFLDTNVEDTYYVWVSPNSGFSASISDGTWNNNGYFVVKAPGNLSKSDPKLKTVTVTFTATFYGKAKAYADPAAGGGTWISLNGNWPTSDANYIAEDNSTKNENTTAAPIFNAQYDAKAKDGYEFVGWYTATNGGGTKTSSTARYTETFTASSVDQNAPTTITRYAYFKALQYYYFKAQAGNVGTGNVYASFSDGSFSATSDIKTERATTLAQTQSTGTYTAYFKAEETDAAYHFAGWYTDAACTEANRVSTNLSYSEQISGSTATTEASAKTITRYAKFVQELTPEVTANYSGSPKAMFVGDEIVSAFSFLNTSAFGSGLSVVSSNNNIITYDVANNKVIAKNEGTATLTFIQTKQDIIKAGEFVFTFTVSKIANTLTAAETHTMKVDETWNNVYSSKNSDGTITTESTDASIAYFDVANNRILAPNSESKSFNSEEVTITISQAATYKYTAAEKTIKVTVNKWDNHISINGNQDSYQASCFMDGYAQITLTATNTDYSGSPISNTQTSGNDIATFYQNNKVVYASNKLGTATWTISQPENYKYKAANASFTIHVIKEAEATCNVATSTATYWQKLGKDTEALTWTDQNAAKDLYFKATISSGSISNSIQVQQYVNGSWSNVGSKIDGKDNYPDGSKPVVTLSQAATGVRFHIAGSLGSDITNVRVTRATYLNAANVEITETSSHNPVHPGETGVGTLTINHSLANGGDLKVKWDNAKFTIGGKTAAEGINLGDKGCSTGVTELAIEYVSQEAGEHKTTVVIYNNVYRATATIIGTTNKQQQTITWKENIDILTAGTDVENPASSTVGNVTYTSSDETVISVEGNTIHALKAGSATITAFSAGNAYYADTTEQKEITVTDDKVQYIVWNQSFMNLKKGDSNKTLEASAQSDVVGCTTNGARLITFTSNNESVVKIVNNNQLQIIGIGTTTITASQAGGEDEDGHTYIPVSMQKKVVVRDPNAECVNYIYIQEGEWRKDLGWNLATNSTETYEIDFQGQEPGYYNVDYKGESHDYGWPYAVPYYDGQLYIDQLVDNNWVNVKSLGEPAEDQNLNTGNISLNRKATKMRFRVTGKAGYFYFKDCTVTLARYLEATNTLNTFEAKVNAQHKQTLSIKYSNIEGPLTLKLTSGTSFSIDTEEIEGECGSKGTADIVITYFPKATNEEETDVLTITDGKSSTLVINLTGSASKTERHIVWEQEPSPVSTVETITFNAEAKTTLNEVAGEVYYTLAQNSTAEGSINGNILSFSKFGTAYVAVNTKSDDKYTDAVAITKTWTVNLTPTEIITDPEIDGDIVYGAKLSDLKLKEGVGAARNTVNQQAVEGTFAITSGDISSAGQHTVTVTFTPANTDMYASCTKNITVTVQKANPNAIPQAGDITYGKKVNESVLTNTGTTEGTWSWTDDKKGQMLEVGTHEGLQVHFTPTDQTNYNEKDGTVSLTVNKAAATLSWKTAPTSVDVKEQLTYMATSNHSESAITYSITAGSDCATIDANTGALTITKAGTITVQASQEASTHYEAATAITVTTTLTGEFENVFSGEGDWNDPNNWTHGVPEGDNPDVVISGNMTIDESISVGSLTIEEGGNVTIVVSGDLTVNGTSEQREAYGDLYVQNGGNVTISSEANVKVHDFVIETSIGTQDGTSVSGQVDNGDKVLYTNGAYIDINMDPNGNMDDTQWYGFTVPFPVDVRNGVARKEGDIFRKCNYGSDYMIAEYDMQQRLNTGKGWKYIQSGQLQPGRFYYLTVNGSYNTYSFKAAESAITIQNNTTITVNGTGANANWNAVGNTTLTYATISGDNLPQYVQTYVNGESRYIAVPTADAQFVVGCPFFFQATQEATMVLNKPNETSGMHYAPRQMTDKPICVRIAEEGKRFSDQIYLTASEDALDEYELGLDLAKAGVGTKSAQLWVNAYDQQLCVNNAVLMGDQAYYYMSIYAPKWGQYELSLSNVPTNGILYLTQDGYPIWNLNESPYSFECVKGTTNEYGLLFVAQEPQAPTGSQTIRGNQSAQKILKDQQIYIHKNGAIFTISGQKVK